MADLIKFMKDTTQVVREHGAKYIEPRLENGFNIRFPYDQALIDVVKHTLPRKATWDAVNKVWYVGEDPLSVKSIEILQEKHGFGIVPLAIDRLQRALNREDAHGVILRNPLTPLRTKLARPVYPYQHAGVQFAVENKRVLIADGVGLGKTTEAIVAVEELGAYPCVISSLPGLEEQWKREIETVIGTHRRILIVKGIKAQPIQPGADIIILNDHVLHAWTGQLLALAPKSVIGDELHRFKVHTRRRSKAMRNIMQAVPHRIGLTGTPVVNGIVTELAALLILIGRIDDVGGYHRLVDNHGVWERGPWGAKCVGTRNGEELNALLLQQGIMCRRTKAMIGSELPPVTQTVIDVTLTNMAEYRQAEADIRKWILERIAERKKEQKHLTAADKAEALVRMTTLRRICGMGKVDAAVEWAENILEQGEAVVLFTQHKDVAAAIAAKLAESYPTAVYDGDTAQVRRQAIVQEFGTKIKALVATIDAAGTGLDGLQKHASIMAFVELPWTPAKLEQAMGRLDRTGQTEPVSAYILLGNETLDVSTVYPTLVRKGASNSAIVDGETVNVDTVLDETLKRFGVN